MSLKVKKGGRRVRVREGDVTIEADVEVMSLLEISHEPTNSGGF